MLTQFVYFRYRSPIRIGDANSFRKTINAQINLHWTGRRNPHPLLRAGGVDLYRKVGGNAVTKLLKEDAVAEVLDVSVSTVRRWRSQGKGPLFRKLNGAVRYNLADLEHFAEERTRNSTRACRHMDRRDDEASRT